MQPIIGKIEQLTNRPSPPSGGSGVPDKPCLDFWDYHSKRHEEIKHEIEANQERIRKWWS